MSSPWSKRASGERAKGGDAGNGQRDRTGKMQKGERERAGVVVAGEQRRHLTRERRKGGEPAEKTGDHEQAYFGCEILARGEEGDRDADDVAADQVRGKRAKRVTREARVQPDRQ